MDYREIKLIIRPVLDDMGSSSACLAWHLWGWNLCNYAKGSWWIH